AARFTVIDAEVDRPAFQSVTFREQEGAFLAGLLAAGVSRTGRLGFLGG
ncbi:MAG TPA: BMP family ABC transporter substrate-binding protein, partial [Rhodospirillum rubrum]|nr:BMP family ABC transporter substrate-binding protein [Rhodospirillum rubrum]